MKSVTYIISNINKALAFEWIAAYLNREKFKLNFILLNPADSDLEQFLRQNNFPVERIIFRNTKDIPKAIFKTYKILKKNKSSIVHSHLFDANIVGLTAARLAGISKRIHTRHHSNYHHLYYPKAIKYDKIVNHLSTDIVAISKVVQDILINQEQVSEKKIHLIHHGFQLSDFNIVPEENIKKLVAKYNLHKSHPVIGVISRYTEWKGIQYIIPAFKKLLEHYPDAWLILANANGDFKKEIKKMLQTLPEKNYCEIDFEADLFALYKLFDVFVHVPIAADVEAFGQTYVEALAAEIPSVFTISGIANDFIKDHHNALVVPYENSRAIHKAIIEFLENPLLVSDLTINGKKDVTEKFGLDKMILSLERLYGA